MPAPSSHSWRRPPTPGLVASAGTAVFRLRHRRIAPGRGRRGLARPAPGIRTARCTRCLRPSPSSKTSSRLAPRHSAAAAHSRASASSAARTWRTSPASPRRGTRCCGAPAGTSKTTACSVRPALRVDRRRRGARVGRRRAAHAGLRRAASWRACAVDGQGRMRADALDDVLAACARARRSSARKPATSARAPAIPSSAIVDAAHARGAWVHVDGAFGLWAAAVPELADQVQGLAARRFVDDGRAQMAERAV